MPMTDLESAVLDFFESGNMFQGTEKKLNIILQCLNRAYNWLAGSSTNLIVLKKSPRLELFQSPNK